MINRVLNQLKFFTSDIDIFVKLECDRLVLSVKILDSRIIDKLYSNYLIQKFKFNISKVEKSRYSIIYYFKNYNDLLRYLEYLSNKLKVLILEKRKFLNENKDILNIDFIKVKV